MLFQKSSKFNDSFHSPVDLNHHTTTNLGKALTSHYDYDVWFDPAIESSHASIMKGTKKVAPYSQLPIISE